MQKYRIYLDRLKIRPCGHFGRDTGNNLCLVATSSEGDQGCIFPTMAAAVRVFYVDEKGKTRIRSDGFEVHRNQHLSLCAPYNITCGAATMEEPCQLPEGKTWCPGLMLGQRMVFLRNTSKTRWIYAQVSSHQDMERTRMVCLEDLPAGTVEVIKEGIGCGPPMSLKKKMHEKYPLLEVNYD